MFSAQAISRTQNEIAALRARSGEELVVVTVTSEPDAGVPGAIEAEAQRIAAQEGVRGTLFYVDRGDRRDALLAEPVSWFPPATVARIRAHAEAAFAAGNDDAGLERVAGAVLAVYEAHAPTRPSATPQAPRLRVYALVAALALAYLLVRGALRRAGT